MDIFQTVTINNQPYKFTNETDYRLHETMLESDSGYVLNYKSGRGMFEKRWLDHVRSLGFHNVYKMGRYLERDTTIRDIDIQPMHGKRYTLAFVFDRVWYGFGFDGSEYIIQHNDGNLYLPDLIL